MEIITAKCSCCGYEEQYELSPEESYNFRGCGKGGAMPHHLRFIC